ncbi:unnamed protein product [Owenia fusiformis]|uniref:Protein-tyrosine-phosphatase n=1 Tax=Owenia fusiformis TaxID=6347 RepID=A0A8S4Q327_OWEFU|nr:unnamed protein product [Owenia fusiformis]
MHNIPLDVLDKMFSQIAQITDTLYLSSAMPVKPDKLKQLGITFVVNATTNVPPLRVSTIETYKIHIDDVPGARLSTYFDSCADKIKQVTSQGRKVLVHCNAGISRSTSLILAYLMKHRNMTLKQAHSHVKQQRQFVRPNPGFWKQLVAYEKKLKGTNSIVMVNTHLGELPDIYVEEVKYMQPVPSKATPPRPAMKKRNDSHYQTSYQADFGPKR